MIVTRKLTPVIGPRLLRLSSSFMPAARVPKVPKVPTIPITQQKLNHIIPRINDKNEIEEAKEFVLLLQKFDSGIFINDEVTDRLNQILIDSKHKSSTFRELIKVSRTRLLRILYTHKRFSSSFYLLAKDDNNHVKYQSHVPPSIVAGVLINMNRIEEVERYMKLALSDRDLSGELRAKFMRSVVKNLKHRNRIGIALKLWHQYSLTAYGRLNFDNLVKFSDVLSSLYAILSEYDENSITQFLSKFRELNHLSRHHFSMLISSSIYTLAAVPSNLSKVMALWEFKTVHGLEFCPADLTAVISTLSRNKENEKALSIYNSNASLHEDAQFDTLLRIHGSNEHWQSMQKQFEELFGRGELPNIIHYGIVMNALARKGELNSVMMLWDQLLSRKMIPTINIFHSLIACNIRVADYRSAMLWFQRMPAYGLSYTKQSYNFLFRSLRGLGEENVQLKLFKRLIEEQQTELDAQSLKEILLTCASSSNLNIAEYVYKTAKSIGYQLGDDIEAIMVGIYNDAKNYDKVEAKFQEYGENKRPIPTSLYNQLLLRFLKTREYSIVFEILSTMKAKEIELDNDSYSFLIEALIKTGNVDEALNLFDDLTAKFSLKQFNFLLRVLYSSPHYSLIPDIYDKMIERNMNPDLMSYEYLVKGLVKRYKLEKGDPELTVELAVKVINTLLNDKRSGEAGVTQVNLPFRLIHKLLIVLSDYDLPLCKTLLLKFYELSEDKATLENDLGFNQVSLTIHLKEKNINEFIEGFEKYSEISYSKFRLNPETEQMTKRKTPVRLRYILSEFWKPLMWIYHKNNRHSEIIPLLQKLRRMGFLFTNENYNTTVLVLARSDTTIHDALDIIEKKLINGYVYLRRKRKLRWALERSGKQESSTGEFTKSRFQFYLKGLTYMKLVGVLNKSLPSTRAEKKKAIAGLKEKYPKTLKHYEFRSVQVNDWYKYYLHRYKKIRFANQAEKDAYRRKLRLERRSKHEEKLQASLIRRREKSLGRGSTEKRFRKGERFGFKPRGSGKLKAVLEGVAESQRKLEEAEDSDKDNEGMIPKIIPSPFTSSTGTAMSTFEQ